MTRLELQIHLANPPEPYETATERRERMENIDAQIAARTTAAQLNERMATPATSYDAAADTLDPDAICQRGRARKRCKKCSKKPAPTDSTKKQAATFLTTIHSSKDIPRCLQTIIPDWGQPTDGLIQRRHSKPAALIHNRFAALSHFADTFHLEKICYIWATSGVY